MKCFIFTITVLISSLGLASSSSEAGGESIRPWVRYGEALCDSLASSENQVTSCKNSASVLVAKDQNYYLIAMNICIRRNNGTLEQTVACFDKAIHFIHDDGKAVQAVNGCKITSQDAQDAVFCLRQEFGQLYSKSIKKYEAPTAVNDRNFSTKVFAAEPSSL